MKRDAFSHTKLKRFCRRFNVPLYQAVGILETLWHITSTQAPAGDIGRLSDEDIAIGLDWRGDEQPLLSALIDGGWLDKHPAHRLLIHDWKDHADDSVHRKLARAKLRFADGSIPNWGRLSGHERSESEAFYGRAPESPKRAPERAPGSQDAGVGPPKRAPESPKSAPESPKSAPESPPLTSPQKPYVASHSAPESPKRAPESPKRAPESPKSALALPCPAPPSPRIAVENEEAAYTHAVRAHQAAPATNGTAAPVPVLRRLDEFLARYPDKSDPAATMRAYVRCNTPASEDACHACLDRYLASDRVARNVVQRSRKWLEQQSRNGFSGEWAPPPAQPNRKPTMVENVTRLMGQRLAKGEKPW